jgi:hypothetical protein
VKSDIPFHLLHRLMDVAVQDGDGSKALQIGQRLGAIVGAPAPVGIDRPEWDMSEHYDRRAGGEPFHVVLQPLQLLLAERAESAGLEVEDVDEPDEVNAFVIEAVPASTCGALAIAVEVLLAIVAQNIVLARYVKHLAGLGFLQHLVDGVEFCGLRQMADVAGVEQELGPHRGRVDLLNGYPQGGHHVGIGGFVEPHVAVTDLNEAQLARLGSSGGQTGRIAEAVGPQNSAFNNVQSSGSSPGHAFEKSTAVNAIVVVIVKNNVFLFSSHFTSPVSAGRSRVWFIAFKLPDFSCALDIPGKTNISELE